MAVLTFRARHEYGGGFTLDAEFETSARATALFGPSGSGKTSVVESIAGMRRCNGTKVVIDGRCVEDADVGLHVPIEARAVGAVFQDLLLFPHFDVARNLRYGMRRVSNAGAEVSFERLVKVLELEAILSRPVRTLSGGERQRVALGRALLSRPRLLVMDEPLGALDERLKIRILAYLERALSEWDIPALFVSHGQADVRRLAEWVVLMEGGRVIGAGPPETALAAPGAMSLKNDSRPMNLLRVENLREDAGRWFGNVGGRRLQLPAPDRVGATSLYVEIPPESVLLSREDVPGISARNHLLGTIREVVAAGGACFVGIDVGQILWAEVTPATVTELGLVKGADVYCLIKTQSLRIVD